MTAGRSEGCRRSRRDSPEVRSLLRGRDARRVQRMLQERQAIRIQAYEPELPGRGASSRRPPTMRDATEQQRQRHDAPPSGSFQPGLGLIADRSCSPVALNSPAVLGDRRVTTEKLCRYSSSVASA